MTAICQVAWLLGNNWLTQSFCSAHREANQPGQLSTEVGPSAAAQVADGLLFFPGRKKKLVYEYSIGEDRRGSGMTFFFALVVQYGFSGSGWLRKAKSTPCSRVTAAHIVVRIFLATKLYHWKVLYEAMLLGTWQITIEAYIHIHAYIVKRCEHA